MKKKACPDHRGGSKKQKKGNHDPLQTNATELYQLATDIRRRIARVKQQVEELNAKP